MLKFFIIIIVIIIIITTTTTTVIFSPYTPSIPNEKEMGKFSESIYYDPNTVPSSCTMNPGDFTFSIFV